MQNTSQTTRIQIIDVLRFILASCVVIGHYGIHWPFVVNGHSVESLILGSLINGPAAVMVFFVISGMCIHLPYVDGKPIKLSEYVFRREIRIGIPTIIVVIVAYCVGALAGLAGILWSLWCEEIYYLLYPIILHIRRKSGWSYILAICVGIFLLGRLASTNDVSNAFISAGWYKTWMLGLPCWIAGCILAEYVKSGKINRIRDIRPYEIYLVRLGIWVVSAFFMIARFHLRFSNMDSMPLFGLISVGWLVLEMRYSYGKNIKCPDFFMASFSLYLCHPVLPHLLRLVYHHEMPLILQYSFAFSSSYIFYRLVERPCHQLARGMCFPKNESSITTI